MSKKKPKTAPKLDKKTGKKADAKPKASGTPATRKGSSANGKKQVSPRKTPPANTQQATEAAAPDASTAVINPQADHAQETAVEFEPVGIEPYDDTLLDVCRTRWQLSDWEALARVDGHTMRHHPQRAKIALLVAAALFQLDRNQEAQRLLQSALDWGASPRQAVQMLLSGIHHCLAEAHELLGHTENARDHHLDAVRAGGVPGDAELLSRMRMIKTSVTDR